MSDRQTGFISIDGERLHYLKIGSGRRLLLAFHGYRSSAALFSPLGDYLDQDFTLVCIDLPHHGKSSWPAAREFTCDHLVTLVLQVEKDFGAKKISLAGYSIGGRLCLKLLELIPEQIEQVLLVAPDGLAFNWFYYFMTRNYFGKRLFKDFLTSPARYMDYVSWCYRKGVVGPVKYRFFMNYVESEGERSFLLKVWPGLRQIIPRKAQVKKAIKHYRIPVFLFMGAQDRIIPASLARRFKKGLDSVQLFILDKGHRVFDAESLPRMAKCLITGTC